TTAMLSRRAYSPPWLRRGGRDLKKISRSNLVGSGRGGSFKQPIIGSLNQPPRLPSLSALPKKYGVSHPPEGGRGWLTPYFVKQQAIETLSILKGGTNGPE